MFYYLSAGVMQRRHNMLKPTPRIKEVPVCSLVSLLTRAASGPCRCMQDWAVQSPTDVTR